MNTKTIAAAERLDTMASEIIDKLVAERGKDDIGHGDRWKKERLETCSDWVYDLAVEVRKEREGGAAWWRVAYVLRLPGGGASAKQGRLGAAMARRLWRAAWGRTYTSEDTVVNRETKVDKVNRSTVDTARAYFDPDENEMYIIGKLRGAKIEWVTRLEAGSELIKSLQETYVHNDPRMIWIKNGPKGRYVEFFEQIDEQMLVIDPRQAISKGGPLRSVYLDRIIKVGA